MKRNVGHFGPEYLFIQVSEILYDITNLIKYYVVRLLSLLIVECARLQSDTMLIIIYSYNHIIITQIIINNIFLFCEVCVQNVQFMQGISRVY